MPHSTGQFFLNKSQTYFKSYLYQINGRFSNRKIKFMYFQTRFCLYYLILYVLALAIIRYYHNGPCRRINL